MKKALSAVLLIAFLIGLCSCAKTEKRYTATSFDYFDTFTNLVGYAASDLEFYNTINQIYSALE